MTTMTWCKPRAPYVPSAAAVGRVAERREQERDVVVGGAVGDDELDLGDGEEAVAVGRVEVRVGVERDAVAAGLDRAGWRERAVAAVVVGDAATELAPVV